MKANKSNYVVIYVKKGFCPKCRQTLNLLDRLNVKIIKKTVEPNDGITIGLLKVNGVQQFPYVIVVDGAGETLDSWSDFKPEKVKEWFD